MAGSEYTLYDVLSILAGSNGEMKTIGEDSTFEPYVGLYITKVFSIEPNEEIYRMTDAGIKKLNELKNENA